RLSAAITTTASSRITAWPRSFVGPSSVERIAVGFYRRCAVLLVVGEDQRDRGHRLALVDVHDLDTGGVSALRRDLADTHANGHAVTGDGNDLVVETDHERRHNLTLLAGQANADHALATATLHIELVELGALA